MRRGERRRASSSHPPRAAQWLLGAAGVGAAAGVGWAAAQPYLFATSVFPGVSRWAAGAILAGAAVALASALLPPVTVAPRGRRRPIRG